MLRECRKTLECAVSVLNEYGWEYSLSRKIVCKLEHEVGEKELYPIGVYFPDIEDIENGRNLLLDYIIASYKQEEDMAQFAFEAIDEDEIVYYEERVVELSERNEYLFDKVLKRTMSNYKAELECRIHDLYDLRLEGAFESKFNRVPKKIETIKRAASIAAVGSIHEIVDNFDMKTINALKKKGIEDMNIFMFIIKNPWFKKGDVAKLSKKEILDLSREESNLKIREFKSFLIRKEGIAKALKIYEDIKSDYRYVANSFFYFREKISEIENCVSALDVVELLKYNNIESIESLFDSKYMKDIREGKLSLQQASILSKNHVDINKIMVEHDLRDCPVKLNRETAEIMAWDDIRQFFLGDYTHCCQKFNEPGESSMLFGLVSKHSGFFTIQRNNKVLAQAWVWEAKNDTLVLDNIELADCRDVEQFTNILYKWAESSPYRNIQLGLGYSDMTLGVPMTKGEINYYSLFRSRAFTKSTKSFFKNKRIYTDAQCKRNWLKKDGAMQFDKVIDINDTDALAERALRIERLVAEISVTNE